MTPTNKKLSDSDDVSALSPSPREVEIFAYTQGYFKSTKNNPYNKDDSRFHIYESSFEKGMSAK